MTSGGFTEMIWHFAGYLRTFEDVVREQDAYSGDPQRTIPDEDGSSHGDRAPRLTDEEQLSRPTFFRADTVPETATLTHKLAASPVSSPIRALSPAPPPLKHFEPSEHADGYGYSLHSERLISVQYQNGGIETLINIHQFNHQNDLDLLTSDDIRYSDGSLVVPPVLDLSETFTAMVRSAHEAVPAALQDISGGNTQSAIESVSARDDRWSETGSPNSDGSAAQHTLEGRIVDGVASSAELSAPTIIEIAPWRPAEGAPGNEISKTLTDIQPTGGFAVVAETGLNVQINAAVIIDANEATGSMIVGGDSYFSRGIVQVNVLTDSDHVDIAVDGALTARALTGGNEVHNVAEFITHVMIASPNGAAATPHWSIDIMSGSFYDVKTIVQFNDLNDSDRIVQAEQGTYFDVKSGGNEQLNLAKVFGLDSYDIIIIGGDYHRADWIFQYNIVLDSDSAKLYATGSAADSAEVTAGFNRLTNIADITTYDSPGFKPMLQAHWDLLDALDNRYTILTPNPDWDLNGNRSGTLQVLYVSGDYYDVNVITQVNMLVDADQVIQANGHDGTTQGAALGGNTALNEAHIVDPGTLSDSKYLGGEAYEESVLIQVNMITDSDTVTIHDTSTLVPELVAFAHQAEAQHEQSCVDTRPIVVDPAQHDHLMSNILS
jgi:hypothetical protein